MKASKPKRPRRDDHKHDEATRRILDDLSANPPDINTLQPTQAQPVGAQSPFAVMADVRALEALQHIAIMLKSAEEVSDEITERGSGLERGLVWSLVHSVEMSRSLVNALLRGNGIDPQKVQPSPSPRGRGN